MQSSTIQRTARTESGASLTAGSVDLPVRGQLAVSLADRLPGIAGQRGALEFASGVAITGLGLRFDPAGPFTSFPLLSSSAPPMTDQALAQLADGGPGGAWRTSVFLVNSGTTATPFHMDFCDPTGAPLGLPMDGYAQPVSSVEGSVPAGGLQVLSTQGGDTPLDSITLPPRGQLTFHLIDRYSELVNRRGVVEFSAASGAIAGLGLRFNPSGAFPSVPALTR